MYLRNVTLVWLWAPSLVDGLGCAVAHAAVVR